MVPCLKLRVSLTMQNSKEEQVFISLREQQLKARNVVNNHFDAINKINELHKNNDDLLNEIDCLIEQSNQEIDNLSKSGDIDLSLLSELENYGDLTDPLGDFEFGKSKSASRFDILDPLNYDQNCSLDDFYNAQLEYAKKHQIDLHKTIQSYLTPSEISSLNKLIKDELSFRKVSCDKYDYMISGTIGVIAGIIDIIFVGVPKDGLLTKLADKMTNGVVENVASIMGWQGAREGKDSTKSAIAFLERLAPVNYDQAKGTDVDNLFQLSTKNHHIKSIGHWPDLIGLMFSILNQFTETSSFVSDGRLITINAKSDNFDLRGNNFISKLFCGFANWVFHLFSDVAGSSGAQQRGTGIPIPFFGLLQFVDIGSFGQHRDTFAKTCVRVFQEGYDFRHGAAMSIPVLFTELCIRLMYFTRCYFFKHWSLDKCLPSASIPEVRRMLLVGHGVMCLIDAADAGIRSGGNLVAFLLRSNLIAWVRFGHLALKDLIASINSGHIDPEAADRYLESEYRKLLC